MATTKQIIQVAKDRALDSLIDIVLNSKGYWNLNNKDRKLVRETARLISLPDNSKETLQELESYINGEEELFFRPQES